MLPQESPRSPSPPPILLSWLAYLFAAYVYLTSHTLPPLAGLPLSWLVLAGATGTLLLFRLPAGAFVLGSLALTDPRLVSPRLVYRAWRELDELAPDHPEAAKLLLAAWAVAVIAESFLLRRRVSDRFGSSRWATAAEIRRSTKLLSGAPKSIQLCNYRTPLGRVRRLAEPNPWPILVSAPTSAGKTAGTFIPTLLEWDQSALVIDVKGELFAKTSGAQQERGTRIVRIDPDHPIHGFNPLDESLSTGATAVQDVRLLANVLTQPRDFSSASDTHRHFSTNAAKLIGAAILLELEQSHRPTLTGVADRVSGDLAEGFQEWLASSEPYVRSVAGDFLPNAGEREFLSIQSSALTALEIFREPLMARLTSASSFRFDELREEPTFVYLTVTPGRLSDVASFLRALLTLAVKSLTRTEDRKLDVLLMIDEFPVLRRFDFLIEAFGYLRSYGIRALLAIQGDVQLTHIYGAHETVTLHTRTRLAYPASDIRSSKSLSEYLGRTTIDTETTSRNRGRHASRSTSRGETGRDLLMADEIRAADPRQCWVMAPGCRPIRGVPSYWFEDRKMRRLVAQGAAVLEPDPALFDPAESQAHRWVTPTHDRDL